MSMLKSSKRNKMTFACQEGKVSKNIPALYTAPIQYTYFTQRASVEYRVLIVALRSNPHCTVSYIDVSPL